MRTLYLFLTSDSGKKEISNEARGVLNTSLRFGPGGHSRQISTKRACGANYEDLGLIQKVEEGESTYMMRVTEESFEKRRNLLETRVVCQDGRRAKANQEKPKEE